VIPKLGPGKLASLDHLWAKRLDSAESLADSIYAVLGELAATGHADDTMVIVTSDNGYHAGTHRMLSGKHTPFREDSVVPAVLIGPGIPAGATVDKMTSTIDLAPTIAKILSASTPGWVDGRDLMPLIHDPNGTPWRNGILTENLSTTRPGDPDYSVTEAPTYHALRTQDWLYVSYGRRGSTLYDLQNDPYEIDNVLASTKPSVVRALRTQLAALSTCSGPSCRVADRMRIPVSRSGGASPSG
jgi:arylsulfatase A-like enzyme